MFDDIERLQNDLLIGSTLVEGSTLSEDEARAVLAGRTVSGHSVREIRELVSYRSAVQWLGRQLEARPYLSHDLIENFHRIFLSGEPEAGQYKTASNFTMRLDGTRHAFVASERVRDALDAWLLAFNETPSSSSVASLIDQAARLYFAFEHIHPFADGNGRVGRILLAYWLQKNLRLRFRFYAKDKRAHLEALQAADDGNFNPLVAFLQERVRGDDATEGLCSWHHGRGRRRVA